MIGHRLRKANLIAKKRFKRKIWNVIDIGVLRKNNTSCPCSDCRNERRSVLTPRHRRPTVQERRAANIDDF